MKIRGLEVKEETIEFSLECPLCKRRIAEYSAAALRHNYDKHRDKCDYEPRNKCCPTCASHKELVGCLKCRAIDIMIRPGWWHKNCHSWEQKQAEDSKDLDSRRSTPPDCKQSGEDPGRRNDGGE